MQDLAQDGACVDDACAEACVDVPADGACQRHGADLHLCRLMVEVHVRTEAPEDIREALLQVLCNTLCVPPVIKSHGCPEPEQYAITISVVLPPTMSDVQKYGEVAALELVREAAAAGLCTSVIVSNPHARVLWLSITVNMMTPGTFCACTVCHTSEYSTEPVPAGCVPAWAYVAKTY